MQVLVIENWDESIELIFLLFKSKKYLRYLFYIRIVPHFYTRKQLYHFCFTDYVCRKIGNYGSLSYNQAREENKSHSSVGIFPAGYFSEGLDSKILYISLLYSQNLHMFSLGSGFPAS